MFFLEQQNRIVADTVRNFIKNKYVDLYLALACMLARYITLFDLVGRISWSMPLVSLDTRDLMRDILV